MPCYVVIIEVNILCRAREFNTYITAETLRNIYSRTHSKRSI